MGKDLHHTILKFFFARMGEHDAVSNLSLLNHEDEFLYRIRRDRFGDEITVWLSDAYLFTEANLHNAPQEIADNDYIIIAKPEGGYNLDYDLIRREKIGVGNIGKFMGAINLPEPWRFLDGYEREKLGIRRL